MDDHRIPQLMRDARTVTVTTSSTQIVGPNSRRVRLAISPPLTNPIQVDINFPATTTTGWPLVVGGFPLILGDGVTMGEFDQSVQAIAIGGNATIYVVDEFVPWDWLP